MIRFLVLSSLIFFLSSYMNGQTTYELPAKAVYLYPTLEDMEGYAVGKYEDYYLIFGGTIRSDVPEEYDQGFPNLDILVIDFKRNRASAYTNGNLDGELGEQMGATGMSYYQQGNNLYLIGGYGYSKSQNQFISFPYITAIDLAATMTALQNGENPVASFYQICDERIAIFNGVLDYNGENFFLINGKTAYKLRPFAEDAEYVEQDLKGEARTFKLVGGAKELKIQDFQTWYDMEAFREYFGPLLPDRIEQATAPIIILEQ
jgi:hypothetical protein